MTYIPTGEDWLYLAAILDIHTRKIPRVRLRRPEGMLWLVDAPVGSAQNVVGKA